MEPKYVAVLAVALVACVTDLRSRRIPNVLTFGAAAAGLLFHVFAPMGGVLDAVTANVYRNEVDHVMDNYSLRDPDPGSSMPMPMATHGNALSKPTSRSLLPEER